MKKIQSIIQNYVTNHERHKKYIAGVLALSVLVSFGVSAGLVMPAISMTEEDVIYYDDNIRVLANEPGNMISNIAKADGNDGKSPAQLSEYALIIGEPVSGVETREWLQGCETAAQVIEAARRKYFLGIASDFCLFLKNDFSPTNSDAEGRVVVGGNINFDTPNADWQYMIGNGDYENFKALSKTDNYDGVKNFAQLITDGTIKEVSLLSQGAKDAGAYLYEDDLYKRFVFNNTETDINDCTHKHATADYQQGCAHQKNVDELSCIYQGKIMDIPEEYQYVLNQSDKLSKVGMTSGATAVWTPDNTVIFDPGNDNKNFTGYKLTCTVPEGCNDKTVYFKIDDWHELTEVEFVNIPYLDEEHTQIANIVISCGAENIVIDSDVVRGNKNDETTNIVTKINGSIISSPYPSDYTSETSSRNNHVWSENILYNFYNASDLTIDANFNGTLLAPNANAHSVLDSQGNPVSGGRGHLSGSLIALSYKGGSEFGYRPYRGTVDILPSTSGYGVPIRKIIANSNNKGLEGATFGIFEKGKDKAETTFTSDKDGNAYVNIPSKVDFSGDTDYTDTTNNNVITTEYTIKETKAPVGFVKDDDQTYKITVKETVDRSSYVEMNGKKIPTKVKTEITQVIDGQTEKFIIELEDIYSFIAEKGDYRRIRRELEITSGNKTETFLIDIDGDGKISKVMKQDESAVVSGTTPVYSFSDTSTSMEYYQTTQTTVVTENDGKTVMVTSTVTIDTSNKKQIGQLFWNYQPPNETSAISIKSMKVFCVEGEGNDATGVVKTYTKFNNNQNKGESYWEKINLPDDLDKDKIIGIEFEFDGSFDDSKEYSLIFQDEKGTSFGEFKFKKSELKDNKIAHPDFPIPFTYSEVPTKEPETEPEESLPNEETGEPIVIDEPEKNAPEVIIPNEDEVTAPEETNEPEAEENAPEETTVSAEIEETTTETTIAAETEETTTETTAVETEEVITETTTAVETEEIATQTTVANETEETAIEATIEEISLDVEVYAPNIEVNAAETTTVTFPLSKVTDVPKITVYDVTASRTHIVNVTVKVTDLNNYNTIIANPQSPTSYPTTTAENGMNYEYNPDTMMMMPQPSNTKTFTNKYGLRFGKFGQLGNDDPYALPGATIDVKRVTGWDEETGKPNFAEYLNDKSVTMDDILAGGSETVIDLDNIDVNELYCFNERSAPGGYETADPIYFKKSGNTVYYTQDADKAKSGNTDGWDSVDITKTEIIEMVDIKISGAKVKFSKWKRGDMLNANTDRLSAKFQLMSGKEVIYPWPAKNSDDTENSFTILKDEDFDLYEELKKAKAGTYNDNYIKNGYLKPGTYTLHEVEAPTTYIKQDFNFKVVINADGTYEIEAAKSGTVLADPDDMKVSTENGNWNDNPVLIIKGKLVELAKDNPDTAFVENLGYVNQIHVSSDGKEWNELGGGCEINAPVDGYTFNEILEIAKGKNATLTKDDIKAIRFIRWPASQPTFSSATSQYVSDGYNINKIIIGENTAKDMTFDVTFYYTDRLSITEEGLTFTTEGTGENKNSIEISGSNLKTKNVTGIKIKPNGNYTGQIVIQKVGQGTEGWDAIWGTEWGKDVTLDANGYYSAGVTTDPENTSAPDDSDLLDAVLDEQHPDTLKIPNKRAGDKAEITVEKKWVGDELVEDLRPTEISVTLKRKLADGTGDEIVSGEGITNPVTLEPDENGKWSYKWTDLPTFPTGGSLEDNTTWYTYYVVENDPSDDYTVDYSSAVSGGGLLTITNTLNTIDISGEKKWVEDDDENTPVTTGTPEITVQLQWEVTNDKGVKEWVNVPDYPVTDDEGKENTITFSKTLNSRTGYTFNFKDLPANKDYRVIEENVPKGWEQLSADWTKVKETVDDTEVEIDKYIITNKRDVGSLKVEKHWSIEDDVDRPDKIKIAVYRKAVDDSNTESVSDISTADIAEPFKINGDFEMNKNSEQTLTVEGAVGEVEWEIENWSPAVYDGESPTIDENGVLTAGDSYGKLNVKATDSEGNIAELAADVELTAENPNIPENAEKLTFNGKDYITLSSDNEWKYTFNNNLPKYDATGKEYCYYIEEVTSTLDGTITNNGAKYYPIEYTGNGVTLIGNSTPTLSVKNAKEEKTENPYELPETGGTGTTWYYITGIALMFIPIVILAKRRKKET